MTAPPYRSDWRHTLDGKTLVLRYLAMRGTEIPLNDNLTLRAEDGVTPVTIWLPSVDEEQSEFSLNSVPHDYALGLLAQTARYLVDLPSDSAEVRIELTVRYHPPSAPEPGVPVVVSQPTYQEARNMAIAVADGASLRRWHDIPGELALRHIIPGDPVQTKLNGTTLLNGKTPEWGIEPQHEDLRAEIAALRFPAVLLLHVSLGMLIDRPSINIELDDLIRIIGWDPGSTNERAEMRREMWRWLRLYDAMEVIGLRPGRYRVGRKLVDLTSYDALIRVIGRRFPENDLSQPPAEVSLVAGPWLTQYCGNHQILQHFGDVRRIAAIPAGKPAGSWAQAIAMALHQLWRQSAAYCDVHRVGEENRLTAAFRPFTRRELLDLFRADPPVEKLLAGPHPQRAREYWDEAIRILRAEGIVGHYRECDPLPTGRQGWAGVWLDQQLDIRPAQQWARDVAEIRTAARTARKRGRPRKQQGSSQ